MAQTTTFSELKPGDAFRLPGEERIFIKTVLMDSSSGNFNVLFLDGTAPGYFGHFSDSKPVVRVMLVSVGPEDKQ